VTQCVLITADNRPQTTVCRQSTVHGSQPTYLNFKPFLLWLVVKKRIIRPNKNKILRGFENLIKILRGFENPNEYEDISIR
jgi:hypothetical protein